MEAPAEENACVAERRSKKRAKRTKVGLIIKGFVVGGVGGICVGGLSGVLRMSGI